jgi:hypothetical protein
VGGELRTPAAGKELRWLGGPQGRCRINGGENFPNTFAGCQTSAVCLKQWIKTTLTVILKGKLHVSHFPPVLNVSFLKFLVEICTCFLTAANRAISIYTALFRLLKKRRV